MANYVFVVQIKVNNKWVDLKDVAPASCLQILTQRLADFRKNHVLNDTRIIQKDPNIAGNKARKKNCC